MLDIAQEKERIASQLSEISSGLETLYRNSFYNAALGFLPILTNQGIVQIARERHGELADLFGAIQEYNKAPGGLAPPRDAVEKYRIAKEKAENLGLC